MAPLCLPACTISIVAAYSGIEPLCLLATTTILSMSEQKKNIIRKGFLELQNVRYYIDFLMDLSRLVKSYYIMYLEIRLNQNMKLYFVKSN